MIKQIAISLVAMLMTVHAFDGMAKGLPVVDTLRFETTQGYLRTNDGPVREFTVKFNRGLVKGGTISFEMDGTKWSDRIPASRDTVRSYMGKFPAGYMLEAKRLKVTLESRQGVVTSTFDVQAARQWTVHFLSHSHQDIGYTHAQADVMRLQWANLEKAIALAEKTKDYPAGARFCWNTEATWAIVEYLENNWGNEKAAKMIKAIQDGVINVDATLGSILSGISRQEELMHYCDDAHRIHQMTGVELKTAMMSDVPGHSWGLATALDMSGVRYFSPAPNYVPFYGRIGNDRAGALHVKIGDHPFWWQSQSGKDKVLVWEAGRGYSWFHGWLAGSLSVCGEEPIWQYLGQLEYEQYPYDLIYLRYTIHGDNGPPDVELPDIIKSWNEKYASPNFCISTTKQVFESLEEKYGDVIPTYGGDMTPTWEDGAASTARETYGNRESAARLAQGEILWSMLRGAEGFPWRTILRGWKNVVLFSEHTWGASASGPQPDSDFTKTLWAGKKMYADSAVVYSNQVFEGAISQIKSEGRYIHVVNTNLWPRTDVVTLEADLEGKSLLDGSGNVVPVQRMHDGTFAFIAESVPPMASAVYEIVDTPRGTEFGHAAIVSAQSMDNGAMSIAVDPVSGNISSLRKGGSEFEYCSGNGLNEYMYSGRIASNPRGITSVDAVEVIDNGPVAATIRVTSSAPGCNILYRDVTLYKGLCKAVVVNTIDKQDIREHESVRFKFPFNFPHPDIAMDLAMSEVHPEREQLPGVNKHYYSLQNGLSVGDLEHSICMTTIDAPFVEFGSPSGEDYRLNPRHGYGWWPMAQISPVVYSWVMNNTWRTNYKASQDGINVFRYTLQPAEPFTPHLKKRGLEEEQRLVAVMCCEAKEVESFFRLSGNNEVSVSSITPSKDGKGYVVCLQNLWNLPVHTSFVWGRLRGDKVYSCDYLHGELEEVDPDDFWLQPYQYVRLKIVGQ